MTDNNELPSSEHDLGAEDPAATAPEPSACTHVIGIGASAGGLESLERFFGAFPADTGMALIVIQHLAPTHKSLMSELLAKHTEMPVTPATHGTYVEPNHVYLIPPGHNLEIREGRLVLTQRMDHLHRRPNYAVDQFFRSLALECAERAIGVVLSGTGSDGSHGAESINAAGGVVLVEDPETAKFGSMPQSTIDAGAVSAVASASDLPRELLRHVGLLDSDTTQLGGLERIVRLVSDHSEIDFQAYKRTTVGRRVERRRAATQSESLETYANLLARSSDERSVLTRDLLVGVTAFFRDPEVFEALSLRLEPLILEAARRRDRTLRVWVAACSTGEEAYTMAILCMEAAAAYSTDVRVKVFATDVNADALAFAGRGRYPFSIKPTIDDARLRTYFSSEPDAFQVRPQLRESVVFARHNLLRDPPFTRIDLLSCRNMLIYLDTPAQQRALSVFQFALRSGGTLLLGTSESLGTAQENFRALHEKHRMYQMGHSSEPLRPASKREVPLQDVAAASDPKIEDRLVPPPEPMDPSARLLEGTLQCLGVPALILNHRAELAYAFGSVSEQLRVPPGRTGWKAAELLPPDLSVVISSAVDRVRDSGNEVVVRDVAVSGRNGTMTSDLRAIPLGLPRDSDRGLALIFGRAATPTQNSDATEVSVDEAVHTRIAQLEDQLRRTGARLQATVEELETSNEELQAANEELVSSNEELQSTNEELQSLNEELHTVNAELQSKVEELSILSADLGSLLTTLASGLLFLDNKRRVRRFNEAILGVIPLVPHDVGRPLGDIAHSLLDIDLDREVDRVVLSRIGNEREVRAHDGRCFSLSIQPFNHQEDDAQGVVLTLNDVTTLVETSKRLQLYSRLVDQSPSLNIIADPQGVIEYSNPSFSEATGLRPSELRGKDIRSLFSDKTAPRAGQEIGQMVEQGQTWGGEVWLKTSSAIPLQAQVTLFPVRNDAGDITHLVQVAHTHATA